MINITKKIFLNVFIIVVIISVTTLLAHSVNASTLDLLGIGWSKSEVNVVIKAGKGVTQEAVNDVIGAIDDWSAAHSKVKGAPMLNLVTGTKRADIVIHMKIGGGSTLGYALPKTVNPFSCALYSVSIQLSGKAFGQKFSDAGTRNVALHELGHALGLGHSDDQDDLMYATADSSEIFGSTEVNISSCDIKGLDAIYPLPPYCVIPDLITCP